MKPYILSCLVMFVVTGCTSTKVVDINNNPIHGASVRIDYPSFNAGRYTSNNNGNFWYPHFWYCISQPIQVIINHEEYHHAHTKYPPPKKIILYKEKPTKTTPIKNNH